MLLKSWNPLYAASGERKAFFLVSKSLRVILRSSGKGSIHIATHTTRQTSRSSIALAISSPSPGLATPPSKGCDSLSRTCQRHGWDDTHFVHLLCLSVLLRNLCCCRYIEIAEHKDLHEAHGELHDIGTHHLQGCIDARIRIVTLIPVA